jgi:hypothetical protein
MPSPLGLSRVDTLHLAVELVNAHGEVADRGFPDPDARRGPSRVMKKRLARRRDPFLSGTKAFSSRS